MQNYFLLIICILFSCVAYGNEQSGKKAPWDTVNPDRPWFWNRSDEQTTTWFEWWRGFHVKRVYQYGRAIANDPNEQRSELSIEATFENRELFKRDPEQRNWLNFCDSETKRIREASIDTLTPYQVERWYDCCGAPLRQAMQSQPQKNKKMIELVDGTEQYLIAVKALDKIKSHQPTESTSMVATATSFTMKR